MSYRRLQPKQTCVLSVYLIREQFALNLRIQEEKPSARRLLVLIIWNLFAFHCSILNANEKIGLHINGVLAKDGIRNKYITQYLTPHGGCKKARARAQRVESSVQSYDTTSFLSLEL